MQSLCCKDGDARVCRFQCAQTKSTKTHKNKNPENARSASSAIGIINDAEAASPVVTLESNELFDKTWIMFPDQNNKFIGTPYPFLVLQIKNMHKFVAFEINICDESNKHKVLICSNKQSLARLMDNKCSLPLKLEDGWNIIVIDLESLCKRVFSAKYKHCNRIKLFSNCRVRKVYFSKQLYREQDLPEEYKIYGQRNPLLIHQKGIHHLSSK